MTRTVEKQAVHADAVREALTPEDRQILALLLECTSDEMVARRMIVSVRTVRRRIARILDILDADNRFAAGVTAASLGLVQVRPGQH
jgi:DNA-binding NarL/FixJ family response regulator